MLVVQFAFVFLLKLVRICKGEDAAQVESTPLEVFNKMCSCGTKGHGFVWTEQSYIDSWILDLFPKLYGSLQFNENVLWQTNSVAKALTQDDERNTWHHCKML